MKIISAVILFCLFAMPGFAQNELKNESGPDSTRKIQIVKAACGQCQFQMAGTGCELAVRIKGKNYFVDGTGINDHGDAHASDGFCKAVRKAEVQGVIVNNRFMATYFKLITPADKNKPGKKDID